MTFDELSEIAKQYDTLVSVVAYEIAKKEPNLPRLEYRRRAEQLLLQATVVKVLRDSK
ncbi:MAG TPA: hypothetical protein PKV52_04465 [Candidatus Saccharibacteria bacterium]|nr:hypothetical protein [Candidatus Saccharibacteria bacterium]